MRTTALHVKEFKTNMELSLTGNFGFVFPSSDLKPCGEIFIYSICFFFCNPSEIGKSLLLLMVGSTG